MVSIFKEIPVKDIIYDKETNLFPYSPRAEIDWAHVNRLKNSIAETGLWDPILVRESTLEGIDGNHTFLAYQQHSLDQGINIENSTISAVVIECGEGMATAIGLLANVLRDDLTQQETIKGILIAAEHAPQVIDAALDIDSETVKQLAFWINDPAFSEQNSSLKNIAPYINRAWVQTINTWLAEYSYLRKKYLRRLQSYWWVKEKTLEDLKSEILTAILGAGKVFNEKHSWNSTPHEKCVGKFNTYEDLIGLIKRSEICPDVQGRIGETCPHLRLKVNTIEHFNPDSKGADKVNVSGSIIQGRLSDLVSDVQPYCTDPKIQKQGSCFNTLEAATRQIAITQLNLGEHLFVDSSFLNERIGMGEFAWKHPIYKGESCNPGTCVHRGHNPPGFVYLALPGQETGMVCVLEDCGANAKKEVEQKERERLHLIEDQRQQVLNQQYAEVVEQTLFSPSPIDLLNSEMLIKLEKILVPSWDNRTMKNILLGWQTYALQKTSEKGGMDPGNSTDLSAAFAKDFGSLATKVTYENTTKLYRELREMIIANDKDLVRWISCIVKLKAT